MKTINNFHTSWSKLSDIIHEMKNAVTVLIGATELTQKAKRTILKCLGKIDSAINDMVKNGKENKKR